jgi:hypothetical protein
LEVKDERLERFVSPKPVISLGVGARYHKKNISISKNYQSCF